MTSTNWHSSEKPSEPRRKMVLVTTLVDYPRLSQTDASSIRTLLHAYDQYVKEILERARQLVSNKAISIEKTTAVQLIICVDSE